MIVLVILFFIFFVLCFFRSVDATLSFVGHANTCGSVQDAAQSVELCIEGFKHCIRRDPCARLLHMSSLGRHPTAPKPRELTASLCCGSRLATG
eukprot:5384476-Amphidinium_carterae.1